MSPKDAIGDSPIVLTYSQILDLQRQEVEHAKATQSQLGHVAWKRVQCFKACCEIVFGNERGEFGVQFAKMRMAKSFDDDRHLTADWPKSNDFITFGGFHVEAASALAVMSSFCRTVLSCSIMAQAATLRSFDLAALTDEEVLVLWRGTRSEARSMLDADKWPSGATARDCRILERRVITELWTATHEPSKVGPNEQQNGLIQSVDENLEGPHEPNTWRRADGTVLEGTMTPSAFALVNYLWQIPSRAADAREIAEELFNDIHLELSGLQQYGKSANNLFRSERVPWSVVTTKIPFPKVCLANRPPKR